MYRKILSAEFVAPEDMGADAADLCRRMLAREPTERLGYRGADEVRPALTRALVLGGFACVMGFCIPRYRCVCVHVCVLCSSLERAVPCCRVCVCICVLSCLRSGPSPPVHCFIIGVCPLPQVKAHPFFRGIDFAALLRRELAPPWAPPVLSASDVSQIAPQWTDKAPRVCSVTSDVSLCCVCVC